MGQDGRLDAAGGTTWAREQGAHHAEGHNQRGVAGGGCGKCVGSGGRRYRVFDPDGGEDASTEEDFFTQAVGQRGR